MADLTTAALAERIGGELLGAGDVVVTDLTHDSRQVQPGWAFAAVTGRHDDGRDFVAAAVAAGASVVIVDHPHPDADEQIVVDDVRRRLGPAAAAVHGSPSDGLDIVGVTGTNGKTTTVSMLEVILGRAGREVRTIGTLTGARTTPEAPDLQRSFREWAEQGVDTVAMEVSSHALELHRMAGTHVRVAVFTNLGEDHLDFHENRERYFAAKASLFEPTISDVGVTNVDDVHGRLLFDSAPIEMKGCSLDDLADLRIGPAGSTFVWRDRPVELAMPGRFNVSNALLAAEASRLLGIDDDRIAEALCAVVSPPGRFETVDAGQDFVVIVDYAHTPDALSKVLEAARELGPGTLRVVFGAGGDRDARKRPLMGAAATAHADEVIVTTDNPRSEDPEAIIGAVIAGCPRPPVVVVDRREAIGLAVERSVAGDVVVIAGKGHESTQEVRGRHLEFDDRVVAGEALAAMRRGRTNGEPAGEGAA